MLVNLKRIARGVNLDFKMHSALEKQGIGSSEKASFHTNRFLKLYSDTQTNMAFVQVYVNYLSSGSELLYNVKIQGYIAPLATAVIALNEMEAAAQTVGLDLKRNSFVENEVCSDYYFSEKMMKPNYYKSTFQAGVEKFRGWKFYTYNCN